MILVEQATSEHSAQPLYTGSKLIPKTDNFNILP